MYTVECSARFKAKQGLTSPVLRQAGVAPTAPKDGFAVKLRVGVTFAEVNLTARGWFVDTDALQVHVDELAQHLASAPWTEMFHFRPTFEHVARDSFHTLANVVPGLSYVELENIDLGVKTRYQGPAQ